MIPAFDTTPLLSNLVTVASGAAQANNAVLAGAQGKTTYLSGFMITGLGATSASTIVVTITGLVGGGTPAFQLSIPAGATILIAPLEFKPNVPLPASGQNQAITVNVPSFGAGNTAACVTAYGFQT